MSKTIIPPERDTEKAWGIEEFGGHWWYYDGFGVPRGPFDDEDAASDALDAYALCHEADDDAEAGDD